MSGTVATKTIFHTRHWHQWASTIPSEPCVDEPALNHYLIYSGEVSRTQHQCSRALRGSGAVAGLSSSSNCSRNGASSLTARSSGLSSPSSPSMLLISPCTALVAAAARSACATHRTQLFYEHLAVDVPCKWASFSFLHIKKCPPLRNP